MSICFKRGKGRFDLKSKFSAVHMERAFCAAEWIDDTGVIHILESLDRAETEFTHDHRQIRAVYQAAGLPQMTWELCEEADGLTLRVALKNTTKRPLRLRRLSPLVLDFNRNAGLEPGCSLPQAYFVSKPDTSRVDVMYLWSALYDKSVFKAESLCGLYDCASQHSLTFGYLTMQRMPTQIVLDFSGHAPATFRAECYGEASLLAPGATVHSETLWVHADASARHGLEMCVDRIARALPARRKLAAPSGWSTWDYYFNNISEATILENIGFLKAHRDDFPITYIQIDSGYAKPWGMWDSCWDRQKFPHGPAGLVRRIKAHGFKAGLWMVPFFVLPDSPVARQHADWLIKDADGQPLKYRGHGYWLDGTHPGAQAWLRALAERVTRQWGFAYIKLDGYTNIAMTPGGHYNPTATGVQAYHEGLKAFRAGMAPGAYLMGMATGAAIGIMDGSRIGEDVGARWDWSKVDVHHGERDRYHGSGYVKRALSSTLNSCYLHNRLWINDGDYLVVRDDLSELTVDEARTWASILGLYGGAVILSDRMVSLTPERLEIAKKVFPLYPASAVPVDFLKSAIPQIMALDVSNRSEQWKIAAVFNYADKAAVVNLDFKELGLHPRRGYHIHEFWGKKYMGVYSRRLSTALEPHACKVFALRPDQGTPQLVGTDIHITQGGTEIEQARWDGKRHLNIRLKAIGHKTGQLFVAVPKGWTFKCATPTRVIKEKETKDNVLHLTVAYARRQNIALTFSRP